MSDRDPTKTANEILEALNGYNLVEALGILSVVQLEMYLISSGVATNMSVTVSQTSGETH